MQTGRPVLKRLIFRARIDSVQTDHFLHFILQPGVLQDVAFGTKSLKPDSGDRIIIPAVVRTILPTRIIEHYIRYCTQQQFAPAGERSLHRILDTCSATMQKSLQGLDNINAKAAEEVNNVIKIIKSLVGGGNR